MKKSRVLWQNRRNIPLLPWAVQTAQQVKFMLSNMAHKATVYKTGELTGNRTQN